MLRTAAAVLGALVVAAALAHGYAWAQWRASFGSGPYEQRLAEARRASAVEPWNAASARTAETVGYRREALLRSHQVVDGRRVDMLLYAALRSERP